MHQHACCNCYNTLRCSCFRCRRRSPVMSGEPQQPFDFTFPTLAPGQAPAGAAAGLSPPANPFGVSSRAQATPQQQQQPLSVQLQQPVQPASFQPLTARSTVVHASSRAAAPQSQQQQGQQQQQAAPKPVPVTQVRWQGTARLQQSFPKLVSITNSCACTPSCRVGTHATTPGWCAGVCVPVPLQHTKTGAGRRPPQQGALGKGLQPSFLAQAHQVRCRPHRCGEQWHLGMSAQLDDCSCCRAVLGGVAGFCSMSAYYCQ